MFGKKILAVEHQHGMRTQGESQCLSLEHRTFLEGFWIAVHADPVTLEPSINRLKPIGIGRTP